jgi:hypothetical protein
MHWNWIRSLFPINRRSVIFAVSIRPRKWIVKTDHEYVRKLLHSTRIKIRIKFD